MSHYSFGKKDDVFRLNPDGKWHHLPIIRANDPDLDLARFEVTVQDGWVVGVAPKEIGRYRVQIQLNGQAGVTEPDGAYDELLQPETKIEVGVLRWPIATSLDGLTARGSIDTLRRQPRYAWAETLPADIEINAPGSKDSERIGIEYKVKGGFAWSFDRIVKLTRQYDIDVR